MEQGEAYFINSDMSRLLWKVRRHSNFFHCLQKGCLPTSSTGRGDLGEGSCVFRTFFTKVKCLHFSVWGREGELKCVERHLNMFLAFSVLQEASGLSLFCMGGYWRFGWKENLNLKSICSMFWLMWVHWKTAVNRCWWLNGWLCRPQWQRQDRVQGSVELRLLTGLAVSCIHKAMSHFLFGQVKMVLG